MDGLKLFSRDKTQSQEEMNNVKMFSDVIQMESGLDKSTTAVFKHGTPTKSQNSTLINQIVIRNTELDETYKYLEREESNGIENSQMKDKLVRGYYRWVQQIFNGSKTQRTRNIIK
jgi:hypothetical protein